MGLKGAPSFMDIRSAVSTYVSITNTKHINSMCVFFILMQVFFRVEF